jgi:hypothetical protein
MSIRINELAQVKTIKLLVGAIEGFAMKAIRADHEVPQQILPAWHASHVSPKGFIRHDGGAGLARPSSAKRLDEMVDELTVLARFLIAHLPQDTNCPPYQAGRFSSCH